MSDTPAAWPTFAPARAADAPEGWREIPLHDPYEAFMGPLFAPAGEIGPSGPERLGFRVDERHLNGMGVAHGGMLMSFADAACGTCAWHALGRAPCVTLSLQTHFLAPARFGDWVEGVPRLTRKGRSIVFVTATFTAEDTDILTVQSVWKKV